MGEAELRAFQAEVGVIVEANPDHAQQLRSEACEPAIVGGSGFSRRRQLESARANAGRCSAAHHFFEHVQHQVSHALIETAARSERGNKELVLRDRTVSDERRVHSPPLLAKIV